MGSLFASILRPVTSIEWLLSSWERNPGCRWLMWERRPIIFRNILRVGKETRSQAACRGAAAGKKLLLQYRTAKLKFTGMKQNFPVAPFALTRCNRDSSVFMRISSEVSVMPRQRWMGCASGYGSNELEASYS